MITLACLFSPVIGLVALLLLQHLEKVIAPTLATVEREPA